MSTDKVKDRHNKNKADTKNYYQLERGDYTQLR